MRLTLKDKKILVLGLGETGLSVLRWLTRHDAKKVSVADSREQPPQRDLVAREFPHVHIYTGTFQEATFLQAELILISPGIALAESAVQAAIAAEPKPNHVPRERAAPVSLDTGPLVLVETKRDLRNMTLPFEETK